MAFEAEWFLTDVNGEKGTLQWFMNTGLGNPGGNALTPLIQAVTNAAVNKLIHRGFDASIVGSTSTGPYDEPEDKLTIEFIESGSGALVTHEIPAPLDSCFLGDQETIDQTFCATLLTAFTVNVKGPNGGALAFRRGYRSRSKRYKASL